MLILQKAGRKRAVFGSSLHSRDAFVQARIA
jgi:hypothetical protein